jgi:uncharacterized protein (TIGR02594 family)
MKLPTQYQWLESLKGMPNTIKCALAEYGVQEVVGRGSNKTILAWRDELDLAGVKIAGYSDDDIAWCGLFAAVVCYRRLKKAAEVVKEPLWARNWGNYGVGVAVRRGGRLVNLNGLAPSLGDVLVFERGDGGHVGFYVAEDATAFHVLAGNQGNKVCILRIAKSRCLSVRRPPYLVAPKAMKPYLASSSGELSANEA